MTYGTPCTADEVLLAVGRRLAEAVALPADRVFASLAPDDWHLRFPPADRFVTLRPSAAVADQAGVAGGGRLTTAFDLAVRVALFGRLDRDHEGRHTLGVTGASHNLLAAWHKVLDGLQMYSPTRPGEAACLLREPMRVVRWAAVPKAAADGSPWCVVESEWQADYRARLT